MSFPLYFLSGKMSQKLVLACFLADNCIFRRQLSLYCSRQL